MDLGKVVMTEQTQEMNPMAVIQGDETTSIGLWDAIQSIKAAAADPAVQYIYLRPEGFGASIAQVEELRQAIAEFRKSGKAVVAYLENPTTGAYYLATAADKIYMGSYCGGTSMMTGVGTQMFFLKDLLDKFGVNVQLIRHGKYKSAGEMYIKNKPSDENMEQNQEMINSIWTNLAEVICESRDITREKLDSLIDNLCLCTPQDFLKYSLVDELLTKEELKEKLAALAVKDSFKEVQMIPFKDYVTVLTTTPSAAKNKIAIIFAEGEIVDGKDKQAVAGDRFASIIADVRADSSVKAVVLRVASPGGSVLASEKIRNEIDLLRKEKPVIASYGSYAASGGYWISNSCDKIYSDPSTLTGSIGVFSMIPDLSKTAKDILKVNVTSVGSSRHSDMFSLIRPLDAQEVAYMQKSVNDIYDAFLANVSEGRGMSTEEINKIAQGRVWTGADALKIGLVDEIGSLYDAVSYAAGTQGDGDLADWSIACYPKPQTLLEMIMESLSGTSSVMAGTPFAPVEKAYKDWNWNSSERIYARMPYIMEIK
jgi:signal peptide peptidase sppA, 67K type